jgi:hypothetical protein
MDKFQICKLQGRSNWTVWKLLIGSNLQYHDFEGILSAAFREPDVPPAESANQQKKEHETACKLFKRANEYAVTLLSTTVEDEPLQLILMFKTARDIWDKL